MAINAVQMVASLLREMPSKERAFSMGSGVVPTYNRQTQLGQFILIRYSYLIRTVEDVTHAGGLTHRSAILGITHKISGNDVQIDGECLSIHLPNAVKIGFQSVMILNIPVPGYRILSKVLRTADMFSHINTGNRFCFSLIGICNGERKFLPRHLRLPNRIAQKQKQQRDNQIYNQNRLCFLKVFVFIY